MKLVYEARDAAEAQLVQGFLEAEMIRAVVQSGALGAVLGEVAGSPESLPGVWVDDPDFDRAREIVDQFKSGAFSDTSSGGDWTCPNCNEVLGGQFTTCWHCGHARPKST